MDEIRKHIKEILLELPIKDLRKLSIEQRQYIEKLACEKFKNNKKVTIFAILNDIYEWPVCPVCGKEIKASVHGTLNTYCSQKCKYSIKENNDVRKEKMKNTMLKKYGVEHNWNNGLLRKHQEQTCLKKYGVKSYSQTDEFKQKYKQTCLEKYNTENYSKTEECKQRVRETCLKKYGVEYAPFLPEYVDKRKQTLLDRYGVNCSLLIDEIKESQIINQNKMSYERILKINTHCIPMFTEEEYIQYGSKHEYEWKCIKCGRTFMKFPRNEFNGFKDIRCPYCVDISTPQQELHEFLNNFNLLIKYNDRTLISPLELDVVIPDKSLAIEFNGTYWHSDVKRSKFYHIHKTNKCNNKNYKLIHIWEWDWIHKKDIIKGRLTNLLEKNIPRIYARNCIVKEIDNQICSSFLDTYHLQGNIISKIKLGLYYNNELISVMTFSKPRFNSQCDWEMLRFCSKFGIHIIGGASKLLKYFERKYNPNSILTYADRCWSTGDVYKKLGFEFIQNTPPNYFYYKNGYRYSRYQCQKHKLIKILGENFDPSLTEYENMRNNNFSRVFDCGNMVFIKKFK